MRRWRLSPHTGRDRPWSAVPRPLYLLLIVALLGQGIFHAGQPRPVARAEALPHPAKRSLFQVASLGEPVTLSRVLMVWLQAFDYQSGISLRFAQLDPYRLVEWLTVILALDTRSDYPLLAASHLYADIPREETQRVMSAFVLAQFLQDPNRRWKWLGHVAIMAKHRLKDLPLAMRYARALERHATGPGVPAWVRQMPLSLLEDMGELEAARLYIGGLLVGGGVTTKEERRLLQDRLEALEQKTPPP